MWPSTSCCTRAGSQVGIWLEIAVTIPNANEAKPSRRRIRRMRRSRSLRILRPRPFRGAPSLRLRRNKRPIVAGSLVRVDRDERRVLRHVGAAVLLLGDQYGRAAGDGQVERNGGHVTPGVERAGRPRLA